MQTSLLQIVNSLLKLFGMRQLVARQLERICESLVVFSELLALKIKLLIVLHAFFELLILLLCYLADSLILVRLLDFLK